jgi:hypothetical protein
MRDLMAAADVYASLHRSEGLGLTMLEALAHGKPVVATDWSGNTDFMNVGNSFPVRYRMTTLERDVGPYRAGEQWAEPSVEHAAELLRLVFEQRAEAMERAELGRQQVLAEYSPESVGQLMRQRLMTSRSRIQARFAATAARAAGAADGSKEPEETSPGPAIPDLELDRSQFGRYGSLLKRLVARLTRFQTHNQRAVNSIFAEYMRELAVDRQRQAERLDELERQVDRLSATVQKQQAAALEAARRSRGPS